MPSNTQSTLTDALRSTAHLLTGSARDYDPLFDLIGEARVVLLGEASHGTHDFYHHRAQITERLIKEKGFTAVTVEADWPDAYRLRARRKRRHLCWGSAVRLSPVSDRGCGVIPT